MRRFTLVLLLLFAAYIMPASAQPITVGACTGYQSVIRSGIQARVSPGASNRIRQTPGLAAERIGEMPAGSVFAVLAGPACADDFTWWLIRFGSITGWTAEGEGTTHWIRPAAAENHAPKQPPGSLGGTSVSVLYSFGLCSNSLNFELSSAFDSGTEGNLNHQVVFTLGEDTLRAEPGACAPSGLADDMGVLSPFGTEMPADIEIFGELGYLRATLPDIAYTLPGVWALRIRNYWLYIDIREPVGPFMQGLVEGAAGEQGVFRLVMGGFQPGERVVIVTSRTVSDAVGYRPSEGEVFEEIDESTGIGTLLIEPFVYDAIIEMAYIDPSRTLTNPEFTILPEFSADLTGSLVQMDSYATSEIGKLVFDQFDADLSVVEGLGMADDSGSTNGIFGMTFQDFAGSEVTVDANGFALGTYALDGRPLAAIGQSGSLAVWTNLADLYAPGAPGDTETLRQTLFNAYWAGEEASPLPCEYTVASGDTLNRIARSYGITLDELLAVNPHVENPDVIRRGLVLAIPNCSP